jgi:hypothetical protein
MRLRALLLMMLLAACNSSNPLYGPGGDGGGGGSNDLASSGDLGFAGNCASLGEGTCAATPQCHELRGSGDPTCKNAWGYCPGPFLACEDNPAQCESSGPLSCAVDPPICQGPYVVNWRGGCPFGCVLRTACAKCDPGLCPACIGLGEQACRASPDCHALYVDPGTCDCAPVGCCMMFQRCADGPPVCDANPTCASPQPICGGDYVASFVNGCSDGCVHWEDCPGACLSNADCNPGDLCCGSPVGGDPRKFCFHGSACPP